MEKPDKQHFVNLVYDNINIIYKICRLYSSIEDEDLQQEIIYQLWKSYPSFRGASKFQTWMYRIALNTAIMGIRKRKFFTVPITKEMRDNTGQWEESPMEDQIQSLYNHISKLNKLDKAIIFLYLEKCSYEEIGKVLGLSPGHVGVKLNRIKKKLRSMFESYKV
jgi:RNA polymerase sigma-70 factor (ECF subfamily)